jgi:large subunit ribosomal protein L19
MKNPLVTAFENKIMAKYKKNLPTFRAGDTVRIDYRIQEGGSKDRVQAFEGVVLRVKRGTADASFTVRKISANNVGVERIFPMHSPNIEKITVKARGVVRRSRLYYLRDLAGKAARIRSRFQANDNVSTTESSPIEAKA